MLSALRLAWQLQRFELVVLVGACLSVAGACVVVSLLLSAANAELLACQAAASGTADAGSSCRAIEGRMVQLGNLTVPFTILSTVAPFLVGIFLGAPLVAREIEHGTTAMAWSLTPFRWKWLAMRSLPVAAMVLVVLVVLGQASESLILAAQPGEIGFRNFAMHGPLLALRGLAIFGIGLLVGAILGRSLPAILVTIVVAVGLVAGLHFARYELMEAESVWVDPSQGGFGYDYVHASGFRFADSGEIIGFEEAFERYPEVFVDERGDQVPPGTTMVFRVNPPEQYASFVLRESLALVAISVLSAGAAVAVVRGRRPS